MTREEQLAASDDRIQREVELLQGLGLVSGFVRQTDEDGEFRLIALGALDAGSLFKRASDWFHKRDREHQC